MTRNPSKIFLPPQLRVNNTWNDPNSNFEPYISASSSPTVISLRGRQLRGFNKEKIPSMDRTIATTTVSSVPRILCTGTRYSATVVTSRNADAELTATRSSGEGRG